VRTVLGDRRLRYHNRKTQLVFTFTLVSPLLGHWKRYTRIRDSGNPAQIGTEAGIRQTTQANPRQPHTENVTAQGAQRARAFTAARIFNGSHDATNLTVTGTHPDLTPVRRSQWRSLDSLGYSF